MNPSIPASEFVNVIPSVLSAGGADLAMNAVFLTTDPSIPVGTVQQFGSASDVEDWFGPSAPETALANIYFAGYNGATQLPSVLYFVQDNTAAVAGYLRGGALTGKTLTQLQALAGVVTVVIDSVSHVSAAIDLSSASSFSNAAALITAGLAAGTPSTAAVCSYDALRNAFVITSTTTGAASTVAFPTTDSLTTGLLLTAATGAVLSPGAIAATPAGLMNGVVAQTQDWATFMNVTDPDNGAAGGPIKLAYATWNAAQNAAYAYIAPDSDPTPAAGTDGASFGALVAALVGTIPVWSATQGAAVGAFLASFIASVNYPAPGGRTTAAFRSSPVVTPDITNLTTYLNLVANGYNCYADVATRTTAFQWLQPGLISSTWKWIDSYMNQIFWNARFQTDFAELESQVPSIPYTPAGYNMIRQALMPDIVAMGAAGAWRPGVTLSGSQQVAVNTAAGLNIAPTLQTQGWYLQITDPGATVRSTRGSPNITFWYTDGGSVQKIVMASVNIE